MRSAAYDSIADWYEEYITSSQRGHSDRVERMLSTLLGAGRGVCLDICCGTGVRTPALNALGWTSYGVDVSLGQLRYAAARLPVVLADATALPVPSGSAAAVLCVLSHTDMPDYAALAREAARVLEPGGSFVHIGVHPCFCGAFADRSDLSAVVLGPGYADRRLRFDAWSPHGVRARVGARHLPLAALLHAVIDAGLSLAAVSEAGEGELPDLLGLRAVQPS
jgi:SAM-dependent methyltransferase